MICDFCGKTLGYANVIVVPPSKIVGATRKGFVPRNLPPSWKAQFEQQGITDVALHVAINAHWKNVVDGNDSEDWGLCKSCKDELDQHLEKTPKRQRQDEIGVVAKREETGIDAKRVEELCDIYKSKDSKYLREILDTNDKAQYTKEAFEAIKRTLSNREEKIPENNDDMKFQSNPEIFKSDDLSMEKKARNMVFYLILGLGSALTALTLVFGYIEAAIFWGILFFILLLLFSKTRNFLKSLIIR